MSNKRISDTFTERSNSRELEIFLLRDNERKEFRAIQQQGAWEIDGLSIKQQERHSSDVEEAKKEIAKGHSPEPAPSWIRRGKGLSASQIQMYAERLVDMRNDKEVRDMKHVHQQREDDYLAKKREERLIREAEEKSEKGNRRQPPPIQRDFDRAREWER